MIGEFARSKAGHDKDKLYIIVKEEGDFVYLADGKLKPIDAPKKKRQKHIQSIKKYMPQSYSTNEEIKRAIKLYEEEIYVKSRRN